MEGFSKNFELWIPRTRAWNKRMKPWRTTFKHELGAARTKPGKTTFEHELGTTRTWAWNSKNTIEKNNKNVSLEQQEHDQEEQEECV
jgi:hypothetical protein